MTAPVTITPMVLRQKAALCLLFCVSPAAIHASGTQRGHSKPRIFGVPSPATTGAMRIHRSLAYSWQRCGGAVVLDGVSHRLAVNVRPEPSLSPQRQGSASRIACLHSANFYSAKRPGCVPPYPAIQHSWRVRESSSAPRRKSQNSLTILTRNH